MHGSSKYVTSTRSIVGSVVVVLEERSPTSMGLQVVVHREGTDRAKNGPSKARL